MFHEKKNGLLTTPYVMPNERTMRFVGMLPEKTFVSIYGIADSDPYGDFDYEDICERLYSVSS